MASTLAETKRRGSLVNEVKLRSDSLTELRDFLSRNKGITFEVEAVSLRKSKTAEPLIVELKFAPPM